MKHPREHRNEIKYPVTKGQRLKLLCLDIHPKGCGVFKHESLAILVPGTEKGQTYELEITTTCKTFAFGKVVE